MTVVSLDHLVDYTIRWAGERGASFRHYWPVKGGWEGWVQVDLTAAILIQTQGQADILREQSIFVNNRQHVDLLVNASTAGQEIAVEIKAQSFENRNAFVGGVGEDLDKLDPGNRKPAYQNSTCMMLAIGFDPESVRQVMAIQRSGHEIFRTLWQNDEVAVMGAVWTAQGGWIAR